MSSPVITIQNISATRISNKAGKDVSIVQFKADQELQEWVARAGGFSPTTGALVGQGTTLQTGVSAQFEIENEELFNGDGDYRINIYGRGLPYSSNWNNLPGTWNDYTGKTWTSFQSEGDWTPYE